MKNKKLQIAKENVFALMERKFSFLPEKILNKVDEEKIMDKIIKYLPSTNDEFYIIHESGTNSFSLRHEDEK